MIKPAKWLAPNKEYWKDRMYCISLDYRYSIPDTIHSRRCEPIIYIQRDIHMPTGQEG